jgi:signal transduction histidine kinase
MERTRIAREIHEGVGAALSGSLVQAEYLAGAGEGGALGEEIDDLREAAAEGRRSTSHRKTSSVSARARARFRIAFTG